MTERCVAISWENKIAKSGRIMIIKIIRKYNKVSHSRRKTSIKGQ